MERHLQSALDELGQDNKRARDKALHVRRAPAVEAAIDLSQHKRIAVPGLPLHRDDIRVPGEHDTALAAPERREQIGLAPLVVEGQADLRPERRQEIADEMNELEVGIPADSREPDQRADHFDAGRARRRGGLHC